jgi:hypothetical protein
LQSAEPPPRINFEAQKKFIQKAALRKVKEVEGEKNNMGIEF